MNENTIVRAFKLFHHHCAVLIVERIQTIEAGSFSKYIAKQVFNRTPYNTFVWALTHRR